MALGLAAGMLRFKRLNFREFLRLVALVVVLGCAPVSAEASPLLDRWEDLRAQDLRVSSVAYRLSLASTPFCPNSLAPQPGFILHSIEQYDAGDRQGAADRFGLGDNFGVMAVVPGSPAHRAGLAANDQLVSVNERALRVLHASSGTMATRDAVAMAQLVLSEEMAKGAVILRVSRPSGLEDVRFTAEIGCALNIELATGGEANAWADGHSIVISAGIVAKCSNDSDLALVIAHELAHNLLDHSQTQTAAGLKGLPVQLTGTALANRRANEEEADRLAVRLAKASGFDLTDALVFMAALLGANGPDSASGTHPTTARRLALLRAEIEAAG